MGKEETPAFCSRKGKGAISLADGTHPKRRRSFRQGPSATRRAGDLGGARARAIGRREKWSSSNACKNGKISHDLFSPQEPPRQHQRQLFGTHPLRSLQLFMLKGTDGREIFAPQTPRSRRVPKNREDFCPSSRPLIGRRTCISPALPSRLFFPISMMGL